MIERIVWRGLLLVAVVVGLAFATSGCVSVVDGEVGIPPFFGYKPSSKADQSDWVLRPICAYRGDRDSSEFIALWPFIRFAESPTEIDRRFIPLWYQRVRIDENDGSRDSDGSFLFPLMFYGSDPIEGSYFFLLPFGGCLKGLFGMDRIEAWVFPLYARLTESDRTSTHVLFPFFNWVRGPRVEGGRVWPFYGHYRRHSPEGVEQYDHRFYAWPFLHFQDNRTDTASPQRIRWFWPIYGYSEDDERIERGILWPLITYNTRKASGDDPGGYQLQVMPVVNWSREYGMDHTDFWPFFGLKHGEGYERQFFMYPIQRYETITVRGREQTSSWFLPVYWHFSRRDERTGREQSSTRLWPLASWRLRESGRREFAMFDLLPFEDQWDAHHLYSRLWQCFRWAEEPNNGYGWEFLWGLLQCESRPSRGAFSLFGGLLSRQRVDDRTTWRLLWIPF